jgi:Flp pilus assembly protein TadD
LLAGLAALGWRTYSRALARQRYQRGLAAVAARDSAAIEQALSALEGISEYDTRCAYLRGALQLRRGELAAALDELNFAAADPDLHSRALVLIGEALYQAGQAGDAHRAWTSALRHDPAAVDAHRWLGVLYYDLGAMQDALTHLQHVAELDPGDARPHRLMGLIKKDFERFDDAIRHYQDALARDPKMPGVDEVLLELAESQAKLRSYEAALETLGRCPRTSQRLELESECLHSLGRTSEALARIEQALAAETSHSAWMLKGTMLLENGQTDEAIPALQRAVEQSPKDYHARYKLVQALRLGGRADDASRESAVADELRATWERFSQLNTSAITDPQNADLRYELGQLAEQLGRPELAQNWYRAAIALNPGHVDARRRLAQLGQ